MHTRTSAQDITHTTYREQLHTNIVYISNHRDHSSRSPAPPLLPSLMMALARSDQEKNALHPTKARRINFVTYTVDEYQRLLLSDGPLDYPGFLNLRVRHSGSRRLVACVRSPTAAILALVARLP